MPASQPRSRRGGRGRTADTAAAALLPGTCRPPPGNCCMTEMMTGFSHCLTAPRSSATCRCRARRGPCASPCHCGSEHPQPVGDHPARRFAGDAVAVYMEAHGFLEAAYMNPRVDALVIHGISDLLASKASSGEFWGPIASRHAAAFVVEFLSTISREHAKLPSGSLVSPAVLTDNQAASPFMSGDPTDCFHWSAR